MRIRKRSKVLPCTFLSVPINLEISEKLVRLTTYEPLDSPKVGSFTISYKKVNSLFWVSSNVYAIYPPDKSSCTDTFAFERESYENLIIHTPMLF